MSIWRREIWRWIAPLLLVLAAAALLYVYGSVYAGQLQIGGQRLERKEAELEKVRSRLQGLQELLETALRNRQQVADFYESRLGTERQRLTGMIAEVKKLGRRAGLDPAMIRYPEEAISEYGLLERSMVFGVDGSYQELRSFINLLELSDLFLTLEEIRISGREGGGSELRISLAVSTLFRQEDRAAEEVESAAGGQT